MDRDYLADVFEPFGPVTIRRMFSGFGVSADGVTFALVLRDTIYLRADAATIARFESEGSQPFSYTTRQRMVTVASYWRLPDRLLDEPDELVEWSRAALAAAERAALAKSRKPRKAKAGKTTSAVRAKTAKGMAKVEHQKAGGSRRAKNAAEPNGKAGAKPRPSPATASRRSRAK